jgi:hypothetical protein
MSKVSRRPLGEIMVSPPKQCATFGGGELGRTLLLRQAMQQKGMISEFVRQEVQTIK